MSRRVLTAAAAAALAILLSGAAFAGAEPAAAPAYVAAAVADPGRPAADVERDAERKPAEMLVFAQVRPGQVVAELLPGAGYFTRLFSKAVGPTGRVYALITQAQAKGDKPPAIAAVAAEPGYANVKVTPADFAALDLPQKADLVWTSLNYHDLGLERLHLDVAAVNRSVFQALKPGGLYVIVDHAAAPGTGPDVPGRLHRIDPAIVRRQVEAAGFRFDGESRVLRNPADDHTLLVTDPAIRGRTDQFVYRFRKPK
jgi:predicted methyltransferase